MLTFINVMAWVTGALIANWPLNIIVYFVGTTYVEYRLLRWAFRTSPAKPALPDDEPAYSDASTQDLPSGGLGVS